MNATLPAHASLAHASLAQLAQMFGSLALITIGGVNAVVPEMQRQVVDAHHWMTPARFTELFALAQGAPGPNFLVATLIGFRVAGLAGAAVATGCLVGPTCVLTYAVSAVWRRFHDARWRVLLQAGLTPVTVGLVLSAAVVLSMGSATTIPRGLLTAAVAALSWRGGGNPLWLLAAGAGLGAAGVL